MSSIVRRRAGRLPFPMIVCAALAAAAVSSLPASAYAQDGELERARTLFDEAGELERLGQWPAAADRLRAALRIRDTAQLHYALGWALENDDKLIEAKAEYETALRLAPKAGPSADEVSRLSNIRLTEVETRTPRVEVRSPRATARGEHVTLDGRPLALTGDTANVPVNPGTHVVAVTRGGELVAQQSVYVARTEAKLVEVASTEPTAPPVMHVKDGSASHMNTLAWAFVGGGGALVLTSIALFASSAADASTRDDDMRQWCTLTACTNGAVATRAETTSAAALRRDASEAASRGNTKQTIGVGLGVVGLAAAGVGTYLLVHERSSEKELAAARSASLRFDAAPTLGGAYAGLSGTF